MNNNFDHVMNEMPEPLLVSEERVAQLKAEAVGLDSVSMDADQLCELALLLSGAYHPLRGYMDREACAAVRACQHLPDGRFWPVPVVLKLNAATGPRIAEGQRIVLRDPEGAMFAIMTVSDLWQGPPEGGAPPVDADGAPAWQAGGVLEGISLPLHHDYPSLRLLPRDLRQAHALARVNDVVAVELDEATLESARQGLLWSTQTVEGMVLVQVPVDATEPTDLEHHRRIRSVRTLVSSWGVDRARVTLVPKPPGACGEAQLLARALVHRNYGATRCVVSPDQFGLGEGACGTSALRELANRHRKGLGIELVAVDDLRGNAAPVAGHDGDDYPQGEGFHGAASASFPVPGASKPTEGFTVFFTGLSGAGKSTVARALAARLSQSGRVVSLLDGDVVRTHLSSELTFSREHRDLNIRRIGYVASEITRHGGIAICAPIAPYETTRREVRTMVEAYGRFFEIHVATPLEVCEDRDPKGLYAKAHAGLIKNFTGISDPYELPTHPELKIDTSATDVDVAVDLIMSEVERQELLAPEPAFGLESLAGAEWPSTPASIGV